MLAAPAPWPVPPSRFARGKVYALCNSKTHDVYVGSTTTSLAERLRWHLVAREQCQGNVQRLIRDIGPQHFEITLLQAYPCTSREELRAREAVWVRRMGTVNNNIPGRTRAQRRREQPEHEKEEHRKHYLRHRERIKARTRLWYAENIGDLRATLAQHQERNDAEMAKHALWSPETRTQVYTCPCGGKCSWASQKTHFRTMRHVAWLKGLSEAEPEAKAQPEPEKEEGLAGATGSDSCAEPP